MEYSAFEKIKEVSGSENVNNLIKDGWEILSISPGNDENGAYFLYCMGWRDPITRFGI